MKICPCKDCTNRAIGCHSSCSEYIAWHEEKFKQRRFTNNKNSVFVSKAHERNKIKCRNRRN